MENSSHSRSLALLMALLASIALASRRPLSFSSSGNALDTQTPLEAPLERRTLQVATYLSTGLLPSNAYNCTPCYTCLASSSAAAPTATICARPCRSCFNKQEIMALSEISFSIYNGTSGAKALSVGNSGISFEGPLISRGPLTSRGT